VEAGGREKINIPLNLISQNHFYIKISVAVALILTNKNIYFLNPIIP